MIIKNRKFKRLIPFLCAMFLVCILAGCDVEDTKVIPEESVSIDRDMNVESVTEEVAVETIDPTETVEAVTELPTETPVTMSPTEEPIETLIPSSSTFSIRFIDVGQADAALIECDGHYMLIDGGNRNDSDKMYTILRNNEIKTLDLLVGTHPDEDHIGGLAGALNYANAIITLCSTKSHDTKVFSDFNKYAEKNGGGIQIPNPGDQYNLGSAQVTILAVNSGSEPNDSSIVIKIVYGETSFLFTGDAEAEAEQWLLNSGYDLSADVLKVGHHGSSSSTSKRFLNAVNPTYGIISTGKDNTYGHPTEETLNHLRNAGVQIYRTDLQGDIFVSSDGKTVSITTQKNISEDNLSSFVALIVWLTWEIKYEPI